MTTMREVRPRPAARSVLLIAAVLASACLAAAAGARSWGQTPPAPPPPSGSPETPPPADPSATEAPETEPLVPAASDPGETPGGALGHFMTMRDYRTIRQLKSILTPQANAAYDHDSVAYNGRKGVRLAAWDYKEPAPKPGAVTHASTVRSLWDEQGEAVELRTETVKLQRDPTGPWRVASLQKAAAENLRFKETIPGVTSLRMVLRAWRLQDTQTARTLLTDAFLKRLEARGDGVAALFAPPEGKRHAAFRIKGYEAKGATQGIARVGLVDVPPGRPGPLDGTPRTLTLVKRGSRWLVDDWR